MPAQVKTPEFYMTRLKPHRHMTRNGPQNTGLFSVTFYGPVLPDTPDGMCSWYQAGALVENHKAAKIAFAEWVEGTREHMACAR